MDYNDIIVKECPGLCRCCLSEGCYKDLGTEYTWMNDREIYADMLLECFDIGISQHNEGPNGPNRLICEVCITRLRDACNFKKQVLDSEKKFVDMVGRGDFLPKVLIYKPMKMEVEPGAEPEPEPEPEIEELEEEYLDYDEAMDTVYDDDTAQQIDAAETEPIPDDAPLASLKTKKKRGRPKKVVKKPVKTVTKAKAETSKAAPKGETAHTSKAVVVPKHETPKPMSATKRYKMMKNNAIMIIENTTCVPFKWQICDFMCFFCHKPFKEFAEVQEHTNKEHVLTSVAPAVSYLRRDVKVKIDISDIHCRLCKDDLQDLTVIIEHLKTVHDKTFKEEYGYGIIPYKLKNDYQCGICNETFKYFTKLNKHMNGHYGNYVCEVCGQAFLSQDRLYCHFNNNHNAQTKLTCGICDITFQTVKEKTDHDVKMHNLIKTIKCAYCKETFKTFYQRKQHHKVAHGIKIAEYKCTNCDKSFPIKNKLDVHIRQVHKRETNYQCNVCSQKFFSNADLTKHMIRHFGERIHQCDICKKSYARKQTLNDHRKTHSVGKQFICAVCSQSFVHRSSLRLHLKVHHNDIVG